jgi:hypothetical protein
MVVFVDVDLIIDTIGKILFQVLALWIADWLCYEKPSLFEVQLMLVRNIPHFQALKVLTLF